MKKQITMDYIAEQAGVSKSTVSYVLSGKKKLSEEVRERVLQTAGDLGYRPRPVASELFSDAPRLIRIDFDTFSVSRDTALFRYELIRGIADRFAGTNYRMCLAAASAAGNADRWSPVEAGGEADYEGIISVAWPVPAGGEGSTAGDAASAAACGTGREDPNRLPVVCIGSQEPARSGFTVDVDGVGAGYQAALQILKHTSASGPLLFIKDDDWPAWYEQFEEGFSMAYGEAGLAWDPAWTFTAARTEEMLQILKRSGAFNAVVVPSDEHAALLFHHPLGANLPIISMKQFSALKGYEHRWPGTRFPSYSLGKEAAGMLLGILSKQRVMPNSVILACEFSGDPRSADTSAFSEPSS